MPISYGRDYAASLTAGVVFDLGGIRGKYYRLKSASVVGATIEIEFDNSGYWIPVTVGNWGDKLEFSQVRIKSAVNVDVVFYLGEARQGADSAIVSVSGVTASVEEPNGGASPADVPILAATTATISAARATKRQTIIGNPSTNINNFRVGNSAAAGAGFLLEPGMSIGLDGSMVISAHNEGGTTEALTVTELDRI